MAFVGCGGNGNGKGNGDEDFTSGLVLTEITLNENLYSDGFQYNVNNSNLFDGRKIKEDDEYTLTIKFTPSRDVPDGIQIGLVDRVQRGSGDSATYWHPLSWNAEAEDDDPDAIYNTGPLTEGEEFEDVIVFTALSSSAGSAVGMNDLTFQTDGEFVKTTPGGTADPAAQVAGGGPGPVTLVFAEFEFKKGEGGTPPVIDPPVKVKLGTFITVEGDIDNDAWKDLDIEEGAFAVVGPLGGNEGAIGSWLWVKSGDALSLQVGFENWRGLHIDVTKAGLAEGDIVEVKGRVVCIETSSGQNREVVINGSTAWTPLDGSSDYFDHVGAATHTFTIVGTLDAAAAAENNNIRIQGNNAPATVSAFYIDSIKFTRE